MWFEDYLKGWSLVAKVITSPNHITKLDNFNVTHGTTQGICLGSLLFIIFVNDTHLLPLYSKIILVADNTTIFNSHKSVTYLQFTMEHDLHVMANWFSVNKLSLNLSKTVAMKFWSGANNFELEPDGYKLPLVTSTKLLGVNIDNTLN